MPPSRPPRRARPRSRSQWPGFERDLAVGVEAIRGRSVASGDDLRRLSAVEAHGYVVGDPDPRRQPGAHEFRVARPPALLVVVVRARAARQEAEAVEPGELRAEGVGDAGLEPADRAGAPAGEDDAALPRLAQDRVEAVH